jgi:flagellar FliL protein
MPTSVLNQNRADRSEVLKTAEAPSSEAAKKTDKPAGKKRPSKKIVIILVLILGVGGFLGYKKLTPAKPEAPKPGDVVALDATELNLSDGGYLKIAIAVRLVAGKASATDFAQSLAQEAVIDEFSDRPAASMSSNAARRHLMKELTAQIKKDYPDEVYDVQLTQFITQ